MDVGLTMSTHGLLRRDETDFFLQRLDASEMRPLELARLAERLGYHSLWFSDHVCMGRDLSAKHTANESGTRAYPERPVMLDVVATMGALAAATERIRMAPSVLIAPYRHPLTVAHQFATVDVLSNGRLIMSAGSGWDPQEFAAVGGDYEHRGAVTEECMFLDAHADPGRFDHLRESVLREADRIGRDVSHFRFYAFASGLVTDPNDELARAERRRTLTGTPEQVIADLERFAAHGYSHVTMHFDVRSGTIGELFEIVERFAEDVLPAARELEPAVLA